MESIQFYYPDVDKMTREELVEELRMAKNEVLAITMAFPEVNSLNDLPTVKFLQDSRKAY